MEWISIKNRIPQDDNLVFLVWHEDYINGDSAICYVSPMYGGIVLFSTKSGSNRKIFLPGQDFTHWMPIDSLPKP
jgi:hypothetical protein